METLALSKTSLYTMAGRALGTHHPDAALRNPDYLAERLLGPAERALIAEQACTAALDKEWAEVSQDMEALTAAMMMQVRTRFIEERLAAAIADGAKQVVLLGAGFDTKAYRLTEMLRDVRLFEVDRAATQEYKRRRLREEGITIPKNLTHVAVDFRQGDWARLLNDAGYDASAVSFIIWEGVTMYLTEDAVAQTLRWVAGQAAGSRMVFDFIHRGVLDFLRTAQNDQLPERVRKAVERLQKLEDGEPWLFGIPNGSEREFLEGYGVRVREILLLGGEEAVRRYLTGADGAAYVSGLPGAPANGSMYALAEVEV